MKQTKEEICERCKKNKSTLTYAATSLHFGHGFTERICQECYDNQMKESEWYKQGYQEAKKEFLDECINLIRGMRWSPTKPSEVRKDWFIRHNGCIDYLEMKIAELSGDKT
jgi:protein-arginine kinase activator protein McsA